MKAHSHPAALLKGFPKQMIPLPSFSRPSANLSSASLIWPRHLRFQYFFFQSHSSIKKIFIWLSMSSPAWQIKAILSKIIYGSCSSLSFPLNPLCSIPINILTILLHFYVFYSSSCAVVPSLSLHECDEWPPNEFQKSSSNAIFLTNSQWYLLTVYGGQQSQPWEIKFKERDRRRN